jgi:hypothetical protein
MKNTIVSVNLIGSNIRMNVKKTAKIPKIKSKKNMALIISNIAMKLLRLGNT